VDDHRPQPSAPGERAAEDERDELDRQAGAQDLGCAVEQIGAMAAADVEERRRVLSQVVRPCVGSTRASQPTASTPWQRSWAARPASGTTIVWRSASSGTSGAVVAP
jgi:hypothetical protein